MAARTYLFEVERYDSSGYLLTTVVWEEGGQYYFSPSTNRTDPKADLNTPQLMPKESIFGRWSETLTQAPTPLPEDIYVKLPSLNQYSLYGPGDYLAKGMEHEAAILELLMKDRHPNICVYYGCRREGELFTGICLKRYEITLLFAMKEMLQGKRHLDIEKIMAGIRSGVNFIHSLGLIHNDINPSNIMLDHGEAIIVDFDSCQKEGVSLVDKKLGTEGWCLDEMSVSTRENDFYSLRLIDRFLHGTYDPTNIAYTNHRSLTEI